MCVATLKLLNKSTIYYFFLFHVDEFKKKTLRQTSLRVPPSVRRKATLVTVYVSLQIATYTTNAAYMRHYDLYKQNHSRSADGARAGGV